MKRPLNRKALRRAFWAAAGRLIGVVLGAGAGSLLYHAVNERLHTFGVAAFLMTGSFILILFAEYEREID